LDKTYALLDEAMIKLKIYNHKIKEFEDKLDNLYSLMNTRMTYIEKIIANFTVDPKIKEMAEEQPKKTSESEGTHTIIQ
jgi:hypothetical protein